MTTPTPVVRKGDAPPLSRKRLTGLALALACLLAAGFEAVPVEQVQKQGPAEVRVRAYTRDAEGRLSIPLSGKLLLTIIVDGPPLPDGPVEPLKASPDWQVEAETPETLHPGKDRLQYQQRFTLDPRKAGTLTLQLQPLRVGDREVTWDPIPVQVTTEVTKADTKEARDVLPPEQLPPLVRTWLRLLPWSGVVLVLLALAAGGWALSRRRKEQPVPLAPPEWAARELDRLDALDLPAAGEVERYHTLLSDVVRRYLELRFRIPASRRTTAEFLQGMQSAPQLTPEQQALLGDFLQRCDLAKFARATPSPDECRATAAMARTFVEQTAAAPADPAA